MSATTSTADANTFTVSIHQTAQELTTDLGSIALSDPEDGKTYVDVSDGAGGYYHLPASGTVVAQVDFTLDITYGGTAAASDRDDLWSAAIGSNAIYVDVTCTAVGGNDATKIATSDVRFMASNTAVGAGSSSNGTKKLLTNTAAKNLDLSSNQSNVGTGGTVYIALTGHDDKQLDPEKTYTFTLNFAVRIAADA